jgi:AraC family transcriptional regulator
MLCEPDGMLTVSAAPRIVAHSGAVGWQGALFCELWTAPAGEVNHAHDHYVVRRTLTAYARRAHGQSAWDWIPAGQCALWRPGEAQRGEWRGRGRRQFLFVSPARVQEVLDGRLPSYEAERWRRPELVRVVEHTLEAMAADLRAGSPGGPLVGDCLVTALCASLFEPPAHGVPTGALARSVRQRVVERIEQDLAQPLTLGDLANEAGLGVRQFCRAFRASTGSSPYQYVLEQRIHRAKHLIASGKSLADIAALCGFTDQSQLTRMFTRRVGVSPAVYRRTL